MVIFPSTLIVALTPDIKAFIEQLQVSLVDIFTINSNHSIDSIRQLKKFFSQKPFSSPNKLAIVYQADLLNPESQNALLKILEEPGTNNYLILATATPKALLPTIISRCHLVKQLSATPHTTITLNIATDINANLLQSEKITSDKTTVLPFLQNQLLAYQQQLVETPHPQTAKMIKKILLAIKMISANVDPKSAIDYLLLSP